MSGALVASQVKPGIRRSKKYASKELLILVAEDRECQRDALLARQ